MIKNRGDTVINKNFKTKRMMMCFINVTRELISEYGIENVTIRKVGERSGYNSATMYHYFKNLDVLLIYSSISYLKDYISELHVQLKPIAGPKERYIAVYRVFNKYAFKNPDIYFKMFYGSYSKRLPEIIKDYYEIFPEELGEQKDREISQMLREGDMLQREYALTEPLAKANSLSKSDVDFIIHTIVRVHATYLYQAMKDPSCDIDAHSEKFLRFMEIFLSNILTPYEQTETFNTKPYSSY